MIGSVVPKFLLPHKSSRSCFAARARNQQAQFPPEREDELGPSSRVQLEIVVRDHLQAASSANQELVQELSPLLRAYGVTSASSEDTSGMPSEWQNASLDALTAARSADQLLRQVLTANANPATPNVALPELSRRLAEVQAELRIAAPNK